FSSRRRHTRFKCDWSSDVCSSDLPPGQCDLPADIALAKRIAVVRAIHAVPKSTRHSERSEESRKRLATMGSAGWQPVRSPETARSEERRVGTEWGAWRGRYASGER